MKGRSRWLVPEARADLAVVGARQSAVFLSPQRLASPNDAARGSRLWRRLDQGACSPAGSMGEHSAETKPQRPDLLQPLSLSRPRNLIERFFTRSSNIGVSLPDTTSSQPTIWRSSNLHQSESGYALMSPRPGKGASTHDRLLRSLYRRIERSPRLLFIKLVNTEVRNSPGRELEVQGAAGR
jgi:hypothetical protein